MPNQSQPTFRIVFDAQLKPGAHPVQVKSALSSMFKKDPAVIEKVFNDAPIYLQQNITREQALRYKESFEQSGALCRIEQELTAGPPEPQSPPTAHHHPSGQASPAQGQTLYTPQTISHKTVHAVTEPEPAVYRIEKDAWKSLGAGLGIAVPVLFIPFLSFVFRYLITLVHELGHAFFGWLYGYPSVPAFDFRYGGGVTMHQDRKILIVLIVYALLAFLLYLYRRNILTVSVLIGFTALYTLTAFTLSHHLIIIFMGHGTELVFGGIFLYRAISGSSLVIEAERPLYAFLAFFVFLSDIIFSHRLMTSPSFQVEYGDMKGGGHWMDFSRIAHEFLDIKLSSAAGIFLFLSIVTPLLTYLFFRYKDYIFHFFNRLLTPRP